jgi:hypothetical protein
MRQDLAEDPALILGRLGPPEQLAAAVRRGGMPTHLRLPALAPVPAVPAAPARTPGGGAEHAAIALLLAGAFVLPVVSPAAGLLIATGSGRWTPAQKGAAWILTTGGATGALLLALALAGLGGGAGIFLLVAYLGAAAGSVVAGLALLAALRAPAG